MNPENPEPATKSGLIVRPDNSLAILPVGGTSAMAEMISRSLAHIQTSTALALPQRRAGEECEFEIAPGVKMVMCWIPPGEVLMGIAEVDHREDRETQHRVRITRGFWLAQTQTTQAQWEAVMGRKPTSYFIGKDLPVERMCWNDICGTSGTGGFLGGLNKLAQEGGHFYLPAEVQWEYACRAGAVGPYAGSLDEMGWYHENSGGKTHPVGQKMPNAWGLYDMHGNVWEWCSDIGSDSGPYQERGVAIGPNRVARGGSWMESADYCRLANRINCYPCNHFNATFGFRVARSSVP